MEVTAAKESWKPTSNSHIGWMISMKKAVAASVLAEMDFSGWRWDKVSMENMQTERTTEGDNPVRKANPHKRMMIRANDGSFKYRKRFQMGAVRNHNSAYRKPMCRPDNANT